MLFRKSIVFISLALFFACSSESTNTLSKETQTKVDNADVKSKVELMIELAAVIEESDLKSNEKSALMNKYETFTKTMLLNLIEQNKVVSALINNLSSTNAEGMKTKSDLNRRFEQIEKENSKKRLQMIADISNTLQGKVSAEKIEKINQVLGQKGFLIIETENLEK